MLIARLHQGSADTTARKSASSQNPLQIARLPLEDPLEIPPFPLPPNDAPVTRRLDVHRIGSPPLSRDPTREPVDCIQRQGLSYTWVWSSRASGLWDIANRSDVT